MARNETINGQRVKEGEARFTSPEIAYFNGIDNQVKIHYIPENNPNSFTIEMWVQFLGGAGYRSILTSVSRTAIYGRRGYVLCLNPVGQWQFWIGSGQKGSGWNIITGPKAKEGVWTHLAGTYDRVSQRMILYVNGLVVGQIPQIPFDANHDQPLYIGAGINEQTRASNCFFHGRISGLRIVGEVLTQSEIQALAIEMETETLNPTHQEPQKVGEIASILSYDGRGNYVAIPYASSLNTSQFTVVCWVNIVGGQDLWRGVLAAGEESPPKGYIIYAGDNNRWQFWVGTGTGEWIKVNGPDIALNTWTYLSATYDGIVMKLYVNGEEAGERVVKNYVANAVRNLRMGAGATAEGNPECFLPGQISEVRVWNRAIAQREIQDQMYSRARGNEPGLTGYWPLNEGSGSIVWDRAVNGGNDGTMPSYVEIPYASSLNLRQFTVSCWVNVQSWQGSWRCAIANADDEPPKGYIFYAGEDNRWQFWLGAGEGSWKTISGSEVALHTRTFLAATYDGNTVKFYINGELAGEKTATYAVNVTRPVRIGTGSTEGNPAKFFPGQITEVGIWNRACSQEEIKNEMNSLTGGWAPGLVGYWPLDEDSGTVAIDKSANGNYGKIVRATWIMSHEPKFADKTSWHHTYEPGSRKPINLYPEAKQPESSQPGQTTAGTGTKPSESSQPEKPTQPGLMFDGQDDYVQLPLKSIPNGSEITVSFWAYGGELPQKNGAVITAVDSTGERTLNIQTSGDGSWVGFDCGSAAQNYDRIEKTAPESDKKGKWCHWAFTKNATKGEMKIYLNGELWHSESGKNLSIPKSQTVLVGDYVGNHNYYQGTIRELSIWSCDRPASEIKADSQRCLSGNETGLVGYWSLNEASGDIVYDKSSNENHGKIYGATWKQTELPPPFVRGAGGDLPPPPFVRGAGGDLPLSCAVAKAKEWTSDKSLKSLQSVLMFDGKDDVVEIKSPFTNNTAFTISLWVKPSAINDGWHGIIGKRSGEQDRKPSMWVTASNGGLNYQSFATIGDRSFADVLNNFFEAKEQWVHIAWVKEGIEYRFYRNGELFAIKPAPETFQAPKTSYLIGAVDNFFNGQISSVNIWSIRLQQSQIRQGMQRRLKGDEPGLTYYGEFNEGSGDIAHDSTNRPNNGIIKRATWQQTEFPLVSPVLEFNGQDNHVELPPKSIPSGNEITVSFWSYGGDLLPKATSVIAAVDGAGNRTLNIHLPVESGLVYFDCGNQGGNYDRIDKGAQASEYKGKWNHWAFTKNATKGEMKIYLNGELWHSETGKTLGLTQVEKVYLGNYPNYEFYYHGKILELRIWSRDRSQDEIKADMYRHLVGNEAGLVGYWLLTEGTGSTVNDKTSNANHGTIKGATWKQDDAPPLVSSPVLVSPVLEFNGRDNQVELPPKSIPSGNEITISFWAYGGDLLPKVTSVIAAVDGAGNRTLNIHLPWDNSEIYFDCGNQGGNFDRIEKGAQASDYKGKWNHWAFTKNATNGEMKIYLNGELWHSGTGKKLSVTQAEKVYLGNYPNNGLWYHGKILELSIWNRDRSADEIKADMKRHLVGNEAGLVGYWPLTEGTGSTVNDKTSNANHGTIKGATWKQDDVPLSVIQPVLTFNGNGFVPVKDPFKNNTTFTISLWIKPSAIDDGWRGFIGKRWGEPCSKPGLWVGPNDSALHYDSYGADGGSQYMDILKNFFEAKDRWVHIAWVKEGKEYRFYRNGELFATKPAPESFYTSKTSYWIGAIDNNFIGQITNASIWSIPLTQADIQKNMRRRLQGDEPGLAYYWPFNEGTGDIAHDLAAHPNDGIIKGAAWQQTEVPIAPPVSAPKSSQPVLVFDGQDDFVEIKDPFEKNNTTFTIALWIKPSDLDDEAFHGIMGKFGEQYHAPGLWVAPYNSALSYNSYDPSGTPRCSDVLNNFFEAKEQWVHIAWVKEGKEYRFYRNGELFATKPAPESVYTTKTSYYIGRVDNFFNGQITDVSIWSIPLTQTDIQKDMSHRLKGDEPGLAYYWALNEGSGDTVNDKTKNANHGKINGGATWKQDGVP